MMEDVELLRRYAEEKAQDAFAELVRRRVDLVYSVALRQVGGDAHLAEDVTQRVFADLARKAPELAQRAVLSGWLYRSAQFAASDVVRSERRRRVREQESHAMHHTATTPTSTADWEKLRPLLDDALGELPDDDRDAVALRFFEEKPFAEIGRALRLTEDTARKRVERALDRLAAGLSRRGVTSTSTALGLALANQVVVAAPAGLMTTITGAALATGAAAGAGASSGGGILAFMGSTKITIGAACAALLATGVAVYQGKQVGQREAALGALRQEHTAVQGAMSDLTARLEQAEKRAAAAEEDSAKLLTAIRSQGTARAAAAPAVEQPITRELVDARYRAAQALVRSGGDDTKALSELLWCYDEGMPKVSGYGGVRSSFLVSMILELGRRYPPATAALRERRDTAEEQLRGGSSAFEAAADFATLNRTLGEEEKTLALYDQVPTGDRRRQTLGNSAYELFIDRRRYKDALAARSPIQINRLFDLSMEPRANANPEAQQSMRDYAMIAAGKGIEVMAGAGDLANARALAEKLLKLDDSPSTRTLIFQHAQRAGQPNLLPGLPAR